MSKFTPGPWIIWADRNGRLQAGPSTNYTVAEMCLTPLEGQQANARLIAAAPDMYEALKALEPYLDALVCCGYISTCTAYKPNNAVRLAEAAIKKADGETE